MKRTTRVLVYLGVLLCVALLAYAFSVEHTHVLKSAAGASRSRMMGYFGGFLLSIIGLALLCAYDVAQFFGWKAEDWILQGGGPMVPTAEMEEAQRLRAQGEPLDAIRLLREFLEKHPREYEVMARIAEIYSHDLGNYLAAALEYEELIKHKLPAEQWAWAALHLAKLYGKLDQPEKSVALLERLDSEYGQTVAARRARKVTEQMRTGTAGSEPTNEYEG
jgi:tetratricopeptide (TPR) repeat protein